MLCPNQFKDGPIHKLEYGERFTKPMLVSARGKTIEVLVADTSCGDDDCDGCCTANAGWSRNLLDMEYNTAKNSFGGNPGSVACGEICWKIDGGDSNPTPTPPTPAPLRGKNCGGGSRGDGVCSSGECCLQWGWCCGTSAGHCSGGQAPSATPPAPAPPPPTPWPPRGTCGGGSRGNGACTSGECCSQWGWCGTSAGHCSGGQVPSPTPLTPAPPPATHAFASSSVSDSKTLCHLFRHCRFVRPISNTEIAAQSSSLCFSTASFSVLSSSFVYLNTSCVVV
jgi:hypothetical protein